MSPGGKGRLAFDDFRRPPDSWAFLEGEKFIRSALPGWARALALLVREGETASFPEFPQTLVLPSKKFNSLSRVQNSQGVLGVFDTAGGPGAADLFAKGRGPLILLQGVQDPGNVGVIIRSAAALGGSGLLADKDSASPYQDKALRASAGLALAFPTARVSDPVSTLIEAKKSGFLRVAAAAHGGPLPLDSGKGAKIGGGSERLSAKVLLVLGSEGSGLENRVLEHCDRTWTHPLEGGAESLNVAVAAALFLEARRHG